MRRSRRCDVASRTTCRTPWQRRPHASRAVSSRRVTSTPASPRSAFPPHRIEPVGEIDGVEWFNDSKATSPHAALTAIRSFESIVLIAGGRNKGLDLGSLATEWARVRSVVAIGESAGEIEAAFAGVRPVVRAASMAEAVARRTGRRPRRRRRPALARMCQFRLVPRRRLPGARRGLPPARRRTRDRPERPDRPARPWCLHGRTDVSATAPSITVRRRQAAERAAALRRHPTGRTAPAEMRPPPTTFYVIALIVTVFTMLGLVMVLSASSIRLFHQGESPWRTFNRQVVWAVLGTVALWICARVHYQSWRRFVVPGLAICHRVDAAAVRTWRRPAGERRQRLGVAWVAQPPAVASS